MNRNERMVRLNLICPGAINTRCDALNIFFSKYAGKDRLSLVGIPIRPPLHKRRKTMLIKLGAEALKRID